VNAVAGTVNTGFSAVARLEDLQLDQPHGVIVDGQEICILRTEDEVLAFDDRCPHRGHPLSAASCGDGVLRCALHGWEFSVPDGQAVSPRAPFGLVKHEVRIVNDVIEVRI
jgi:nitrite reductase/ring-hydroxylating ferredoxin subunit